MPPAISVHVDSDDDTEQFIDVLQKGFEICDKKLRFNGRPFLTHVLSEVHLSCTYASFNMLQCPLFGSSTLKSNGSFLGFSATHAKSSHVMSLGKLKGIRFTSLFRYKLWWTAPWVGDRGSDLESETQMLLLDTKSRAAADGCLGYPYILILPIYEGSFRASLQAGRDDHIDLCMESGSSLVCQSQFKSCIYLHAGHDPFLLVQDAIKAIQTSLGTFRHMEEKTPPTIIERFGWCIQRDPLSRSCPSNPEHVWAGVKSLVEGEIPPRFLVFDEGWQSNGDHDFYETLLNHLSKNKENETDKTWSRLMSFQENEKFRDYVAGTLITPSNRKNYTKHDEIKHAHYTFYEAEDDVVHETRGISAFMLDLKSEFELLEDVYAWHTICGYWGGVLPGSPDSCNARLVKPELAHGLGTMHDTLLDQLLANSVGLVPPQRAHQFYDKFHAHLEKCGFTGVKLDAVNVSASSYPYLLAVWKNTE
ncbi:hypothetical protein L7F22_036849 [Adiantum nelumboides]|nr:hypothetical protein [Adiantum nelumboides]